MADMSLVDMHDEDASHMGIDIEEAKKNATKDIDILLNQIASASDPNTLLVNLTNNSDLGLSFGSKLGDVSVMTHLSASKFCKLNTFNSDIFIYVQAQRLNLQMQHTP